MYSQQLSSGYYSITTITRIHTNSFLTLQIAPASKTVGFLFYWHIIGRPSLTFSCFFLLVPSPLHVLSSWYNRRFCTVQILLAVASVSCHKMSIYQNSPH